jgi:hypothetical protein
VNFACYVHPTKTHKISPSLNLPLHIFPQRFLLHGTSASAHRICSIASALVAVLQLGEMIWPDITSGPLVGDVP